MKYLVVSCFLLCTLQTFSQQDYFIYLQTDNNQPFYIRINNNVYSSSSAGYYILTKLPDSTTTVTIGFPQNVFPEQQFNIPLHHKDAGYVLKNLGEKGWGLLNLQSLAVIMSSTAAEEKKNTEISGNKRNDAFSSLLANAVSDTAVLYTVARPHKPVPPPIIAVSEEKNADSLAVVKRNAPQKDTIALVKNLPEKKDSSITAKNSHHPQKDTAAAAPLAVNKDHAAVAARGKVAHDTVAIIKKDTSVTAVNRLPKTSPSDTKNRKITRDTAEMAKNTAPPPASIPANNTPVKQDSNATAKNTQKQKKDTTTNKLANKLESFFAKNKKPRKDTIIMMNGGTAEIVAKNTAVKKETTPAAKSGGDSTQLIKKEILQAPEEKRNALLNNNEAIVVEKLPVRKDSVATAAIVKKDSVQNLAVTDPARPAETKTDTINNGPVKRLRPLVTKAAELLTDTSYIAVFVDESKEKFDTIRISIPFNEISAFAKPNKPFPKRADTLASTPIPENQPPIVSHEAVPPPVKKDSAAGITKQDISAVIRPDSTAVDKKERPADTTVIAQPIPSPVVKKDTTAVKTTNDSLPATVNRELEPAAKKDSVPVLPVATDSGRVTKAPSAFFNSDCREVAGYSDIDKLRIKMLMVTTDDDRIGLAKKLFKQKCLLVHQVKALSELFKSDEGKYKWFDAVYPFVSDTDIFFSLGELIKDEYYLNRFKAMLRH